MDAIRSSSLLRPHVSRVSVDPVYWWPQLENGPGAGRSLNRNRGVIALLVCIALAITTGVGVFVERSLSPRSLDEAVARLGRATVNAGQWRVEGRLTTFPGSAGHSPV